MVKTAIVVIQDQINAFNAKETIIRKTEYAFQMLIGTRIVNLVTEKLEQILLALSANMVMGGILVSVGNVRLKEIADIVMEIWILAKVVLQTGIG